MRVIDDAERFVKLLESCPRPGGRQAEAEKVLRDLIASPWEAAAPEDREAGWTLILRLTLFTHHGSASAARWVA